MSAFTSSATEQDDETAPNDETGALDMIRTLVSQQQPPAETVERAPEPLAKPEQDVEKPKDDRWADLRVALIDEDDLAVEAAVEPQVEDVIAQEEQPAPALERLVAPVTERLSTRPEAAPAEAEPTEAVQGRVWDMPSDHAMSRRGRVMWRLGVYGAFVAVPVVFVLLSPFPPKVAVQHYAAALGCNVAGYMGMGPAEAGMPGYHAHLDDNGNGVACEPNVQRTFVNGKTAFISAGK